MSWLLRHQPGATSGTVLAFKRIGHGSFRRDVSDERTDVR
jgi:hypothetical protein